MARLYLAWLISLVQPVAEVDAIGAGFDDVQILRPGAGDDDRQQQQQREAETELFTYGEMSELSLPMLAMPP